MLAISFPVLFSITDMDGYLLSRVFRYIQKHELGRLAGHDPILDVFMYSLADNRRRRFLLHKLLRDRRYGQIVLLLRRGMVCKGHIHELLRQSAVHGCCSILSLLMSHPLSDKSARMLLTAAFNSQLLSIDALVRYVRTVHWTGQLNNKFSQKKLLSLPLLGERLGVMCGNGIEMAIEPWFIHRALTSNDQASLRFLLQGFWCMRVNGQSQLVVVDRSRQGQLQFSECPDGKLHYQKVSGDVDLDRLVH